MLPCLAERNSPEILVLKLIKQLPPQQGGAIVAEGLAVNES